MRHLIIFSLIYLISLPVFAGKREVRITITNTLDIPRKGEMVSINLKKTGLLISKMAICKLKVWEVKSKECQVSQLLDENGDGIPEELIFQVSLGAGESREFILGDKKNPIQNPDTVNLRTYGRFVPERIDDFAWENDRVAFRIYGPTAQRLTEEGKEGGTLSSGVDCWLKKVSYPVINSWYAKNLEQAGYYHIDHGEGYDPYHVGASLGCGGIGIWKNNTLYTTRNFIRYRVLANGPLRTLFEVDYAPFVFEGRQITVSKRISLDLGSNLSFFDISLEGIEPSDSVVLGITLHERKGEVVTSPTQGWFSYWEPVDNSELGTAILLNSAWVKGNREYQSEIPDKSHELVFPKLMEKKIQYYAGFGWKGSGQVLSFQEWQDWLRDKAKCIKTPLLVTVH